MAGGALDEVGARPHPGNLSLDSKARRRHDLRKTLWAEGPGCVPDRLRCNAGRGRRAGALSCDYASVDGDR